MTRRTFLGLSATLWRQALSPRRSPLGRERPCCRVLAVVGHIVRFLARRNAHFRGAADHVGGALLAF